MQYAASAKLAAALGAVVSAAILLAGAAGAQPYLQYYRVSASGTFSYELDYGSNPASVYNGTYNKTIVWLARAIVRNDGRSLSVLNELMVVDGSVQVHDERTQRVNATTRRPVKCSAPGGVDGFWIERTDGAVFSDGRISSSSSALSVDPGRAINRNIGCAATESLSSPHKLRGGPEFRVPLPETPQSSTACKDSYSHPYKPAGKANGHSFSGVVQVSVSLTPFPTEKLAANKTWLRDRAGEHLLFGGKKNWKEDCVL